MGAKLREYRERVRTVQSMQKITRAMELIAASRIQHAKRRSAAALPYSEAITRAVAAAASRSGTDHELTRHPDAVTRAAVLVVTSDRGLAGSYSHNVIMQAERLVARLRGRGVEPRLYVTGRKGEQYFEFRKRPLDGAWPGISETPSFADARAIAGKLLEAFRTPVDEGGVQELHVVSTHFVNMVKQDARVVRLLPLAVVEAGEEGAEAPVFPLYDFEPSAEAVLDALLPAYVESRIQAVLLDAASSEEAARQTAMHAATDNADKIVKHVSQLANTARQAEITQEISEIVGGADALASSGSQD